MSTAADFDLGPLTWVKSEIDQALEKSLASLRAYAANPGDSKQIKFSQTHFHQAHGALQIVGLDGVTRLSEELDGLLGDIAKAEGAPKPEQLAAAERAFAGITSYLDHLLGGEPNQPLRLFAVYGDVLKARGREGADPVDLYYPDLLQRPPRREKPPVELAAADAAAYYRDQRGRYQRGLLKLIKKDASGVEDMRAAVAAVEAAQTNPASRTFWWVALGFFDALFAKAIPDAPLITRLANRVEQQLKRLMEGSATVAERLMREALFAVARARPATEHVRNVQEVFRLAGTVPATFELKGEGAPQNPSLKALREIVGNAKTAWNKVASGHQPSLANFRDLATQMRARAAELKQQNLVLLAHDIVAITGWIGDATEKASDNVAMEVATAMLLVENAVENFANLGDEFAQQAGLMHQRLQAIVKGETLQEAAPVPVLDEMSRRAQERLLMAQVVSEIQASLRAIEQALDSFFRDASKRSDLATLDKPIRQVLGALTILNEDRAAAALSTCAVEIQRFSKGDYTAAPGDFERVAGTLSGLGFYVDALQHGKADFDQFMKPISAKKAEAFEEAEAEAAPATTVEAELEQGKKALSALVEEWKKRPADAKLKAELKAKAAALQKDAGLVADTKTEAQAADILKLLETSDAKPFDPQVSQVLTQIQPAPAAPAPSAQTQKLMAASDETIDAELLSVYLEEAGEVLGTIADSLEQAREVPQNMEVLRTIRRGFHTLKGSGRMVGLTRLGEAAWAVEQVMNRWLEEERAATPDLFTLIATARQFFEGAVSEPEGRRCEPRRVADRRDRAEGESRRGARRGDPGDGGACARRPRTRGPGARRTCGCRACRRCACAVAPAASRRPIEFPAIDITAIAPPSAPETVSAPAAAIEIAPAAPEPAAPAEEEETINVGGLALSPALYAIFLEETRTHLAHLGAGQTKLAEGEPVTEDFERSAHTLAGIAGTVRFTAMRELAHGLEEMLERYRRQAGRRGRALADRRVDRRARRHADRRRSADAPAADGRPRGPVERCGPRGDSGRPPPDRRQCDSLDFSLPGADTITPAPAAEAEPGIDLGDLDFALPTGGLSAAPAPVAAPPEDEPPSLDFSQMMPILGGATSPSVSPMGEPAIIEPPGVALAPEPAPTLTLAPVPAAPSNVVAFPVHQQEEAPAAPVEPPAVEVEEIPVERRTRRLDDDIDPELLPIFLEEAQELVPAAGQELRDWRANPDNAAAGNALLRTLHTLKGSARMCGAMALGELTHHMESRVENALTVKQLPPSLFDELEVSFDRMGFLYDRLVNPQAAGAPPPEPEAQPAPAAARAGTCRDPVGSHDARGERRRTAACRDAGSAESRRAAEARSARRAGEARRAGSGRRDPRDAARPRRPDRPPGERGGRGVDRAQPDRGRHARDQERALRPDREREPPARAAARDRDPGRRPDAVARRAGAGEGPGVRSAGVRPLHPLPGDHADDGRERQRRLDRPAEPAEGARRERDRAVGAGPAHARAAGEPDAHPHGAVREHLGAPVPDRPGGGEGDRQARGARHQGRPGRGRPLGARAHHRAVRAHAAQLRRARRRAERGARGEGQARARRDQDRGAAGRQRNRACRDRRRRRPQLRTHPREGRRAGAAQGRGHAFGRRSRRVHLPPRLLDRVGGHPARRPRRRDGRRQERDRGAWRPRRAHERNRARHEVHDLPAAHARGDAGGDGARGRRRCSRSPR